MHHMGLAAAARGGTATRSNGTRRRTTACPRLLRRGRRLHGHHRGDAESPASLARWQPPGHGRGGGIRAQPRRSGVIGRGGAWIPDRGPAAHRARSPERRKHGVDASRGQGGLTDDGRDVPEAGHGTTAAAEPAVTPPRSHTSYLRKRLQTWQNRSASRQEGSRYASTRRAGAGATGAPAAARRRAQ